MTPPADAWLYAAERSPPGATLIKPPAGGGGAGTLTVHVRAAGEASTLEAASVARTSNVCEPFASAEYALGELHEPHAPLSRRHWNAEADSLEVNVKLAELTATVPEGPESIVVSGAVVSGAGTSTVQARDAGDASVLPAGSVARTSNVCGPFARPV